MPTIKVKATRMGIYGGQRRREGEVFEVESNALGSWMEPTEPEPAPAPAGEETGLVALLPVSNKGKGKGKGKGEGEGEGEGSKASGDDEFLLD